MALGEVVKGSERIWDGWDWVCASSEYLSVSGCESRGLCEVAGPSKLWSSGVWVPGSPHYCLRVWEAHTEVVHCVWRMVLYGNEHDMSRSCDLFGSGDEHAILR